MQEIKIANSVGDIEVGVDAPTIGSVLEVLKDVDAQRIAKTDAVVVRKGVLALLSAVAGLEERITQLERSAAAPTAE